MRVFITKFDWLFCLCFVTAMSCFGQHDNHSFELSVNFSPSFANHGALLISNKNGNSEMTLIVYDSKKESKIKYQENVSVQQSQLAELLSFLEHYNFKIKGSIDTLSSQRVFRNGDSTTAYKVSIGSDGINIKGSYKKNGTKREFAFWSPEKDSNNYRLAQQLFALSNVSLKRKRSLDYIKTLKSYF